MNQHRNPHAHGQKLRARVASTCVALGVLAFVALLSASACSRTVDHIACSDVLAAFDGGLGIAPTKLMSELTPAEQARFCDWTACTVSVGRGYGNKCNCDAPDGGKAVQTCSECNGTEDCPADYTRSECLDRFKTIGGSHCRAGGWAKCYARVSTCPPYPYADYLCRSWAGCGTSWTLGNNYFRENAFYGYLWAEAVQPATITISTTGVRGIVEGVVPASQTGWIVAATGQYLNQEPQPGAPIETVVPQSDGLALFLSGGGFPHTALWTIALFGPNWPQDRHNVWCADPTSYVYENGGVYYRWSAFYTCPDAPNPGQPYAREPIVAAGIGFRACRVGVDNNCKGDAIVNWDASDVWEWWTQPDGSPSGR
jgi:hypothetical protein